MMLTPQSSAIPTNIITGFLGTGKTTLIKQLLALKPATERWAILVNEFGEVGIDGAFFKGHPENNVYIREVPGGCMCCTSGLPIKPADILCKTSQITDRAYRSGSPQRGTCHVTATVLSRYVCNASNPYLG